MTDPDFLAAKRAAEEKKKAASDSAQESGVYQIPEPESLDVVEAKPFPVAALPQELRLWAEAQAYFNQVPVTMPATFALMAAMTAGIHLSVRIREGWEEPTVWQAILIASPSERKSPVFAAAFRPVYDWGKEEKKRAEGARMAIQKEIDSLLVDSKGEAAPVKSGTPEAKRVSDLKERLTRIPPPRRRIAEDITPEEFMRQMANNDDTLCLVSDEAEVFQNFGGRYQKGEPKLSPLLKGWDAKSPLFYDRVGGGSGKGKQESLNLQIDNPRAGISTTGQYTSLEMLHGNPAYRAKGLMARLCYVVLEERTKERFLFPSASTREIAIGYKDAIRRVFDIDSEGYLLLANRVEYPNGWRIPRWLQDVRQRVELGVLKGGEFERMPDWAGKLVSNLARVAAVLEAMGGGGEQALEQLAEFFIAHAKRALLQPGAAAPARGTKSDALVYVADRLREAFASKLHVAGKVSVGPVFTARDAKRKCYRHRDDPLEEFVVHLDRLVELGHLEELPAPERGQAFYAKHARRFRMVVGAETKPLSASPPEQAPPTPPPLPPELDPYSDWFDNLTEDSEQDDT